MRFIYVVVKHIETGRSFCLDRRYSLMEDVTQKDQERALASGTLQHWADWKPTMVSQMPEWAIDIPAAEFEATWCKEGEVCY